MNIKSLLLIGLTFCGTTTMAFADDSSLPGFAQGADILRVEPRDGQVDSIGGVIYAQIIGARAVRQLKMALLVPRTTDLKPAIVYFPGGGFMTSDYEKFIEMRMALAQAGFVVAGAEYRTVPDKFPAPVEDGKAAVRYLRAHASDYGIDPDRIGVLGDSSGGYVAQMVATTNGEKTYDKGQFLDQSSDVQAAVSLYGISNLLNIGEGFPETIERVHRSLAAIEALLVNGPAFAGFPGASIDSDAAKALKASPMGHISGNEPPFLIMHGSADTLVSPRQSAQLYTALKAEKSKADYVLVEGAAHGDIFWFQKPVIETVVGWFKANLGAPIKGKTREADPKANL